MNTRAVEPDGQGRGRAVLLRFACGLLTLVVSTLPVMFLPSGTYFTWPTPWFVVMGKQELGTLIGGLVFVPLLPLVSYRRRDWLFISFVPFWGFVVASRVGWRLANLPTKDWPLRPDERAARVPVAALP
jgi:hypothetical protein